MLKPLDKLTKDFKPTSIPNPSFVCLLSLWVLLNSLSLISKLKEA